MLAVIAGVFVGEFSGSALAYAIAAMTDRDIAEPVTTTSTLGSGSSGSRE